MSDGSIHIKAFSLGAWMTNCYVVFGDGSESCCIVDAGFEPGPMISFIKDRGLRCETLVLTHSHLDHIAGAEEILTQWLDMDILIHTAEADFLTDPKKNLSSMTGMSVTAPPATKTLQHDQVIEVAGVSFRVLHTPGHSPGGICLYNADGACAFVGDTIFHGSVGRYDFPSSDGDALFKAIREHVLTLPDETRIFPGHGPSGTVGEEKRTNPFLNGMYP